MTKYGLDPHMVYGECQKHPGNSMIDCIGCSLDALKSDLLKIRDIKIDKILKENEFYRGEDSKEGES
jgi:hypothetical protein